MNSHLVEKLEKLGYKDQDTKSLFDALPKDIWVSISAKNLSRQSVYFTLTIEHNRYSLFLCVRDKEEGVNVLNKTGGIDLDETLAKMIIFLEQSQLINPSVE